VIIPTFNRAHFLGDCLQSVLQQSYRPIELILVDDGSTDSTPEIVERWRASLSNAGKFSFVFIQQKNQGANVARNRALLESRGEFIQFLDSDDLLLPDKLKIGIELLLKYKADYTYCPVLFRDENLREIPGRIGSPFSRTDKDITTYLWQTMGPLYRRDLIYRVGPWLETIFYGDDWEYASRVKLMNRNGIYDSAPGGWLRIHPRPERRLPKDREREYKEYHAAYCSVLKIAKMTDRLSPVVCNRLARRFFLNALFFGKSGDSVLRRESLKKAREMFPLPFSLNAAIWLFSRIRSGWFDSFAANLLLRAVTIKA